MSAGAAVLLGLCSDHFSVAWPSFLQLGLLGISIKLMMPAAQGLAVTDHL
jgi:hypothetical protein